MGQVRLDAIIRADSKILSDLPPRMDLLTSLTIWPAAPRRTYIQAVSPGTIIGGRDLDHTRVQVRKT